MSYHNIQKITSAKPKHKGAIFIKGGGWICKVYPYPNGNPAEDEADVIIKALTEYRKQRCER